MHFWETPEQWQALRRADFGGSYIVGRDLLISFTYTFETDGDTVMFAAHVPFSYGAQQLALESLDARQEELERAGVYYRRELATRSLEGARVDLLTISSTEGMMPGSVREDLIAGIFPDGMLEPESRPRRFVGKRYVFLSSRVHPGEVPASHVLNGLLDVLCDPNNETGKMLRERFVFKVIPMLTKTQNFDNIS